MLRIAAAFLIAHCPGAFASTQSQQLFDGFRDGVIVLSENGFEFHEDVWSRFEDEVDTRRVVEERIRAWKPRHETWLKQVRELGLSGR